ncbi:hypothetical protein ANN_07076 [Periplaneta americana]|uniref:Uncharacterized protein n=1 Tax=Periplaneta americana TaxID=6978 RepID=A0ABQ8THV9_PERAM|nr:hypothetical protein ANN_07076 [Periplaneta americana]
MAGLCEGGSEPPGSLKATHLNAIDLARDQTRNLGHRRPALYQLANQADTWLYVHQDEPTKSYPAFARIGLRENPGKNLNQVTFPDRDSNPGHLVSRPDALTVTLQGLHEAYADGALPCPRVARWVKAFREGRDVKVMFIVAYDIEGVILHHSVPPRQTENADYWNIHRTHLI